jgi:hypothetical protein
MGTTEIGRSQAQAQHAGDDADWCRAVKWPARGEVSTPSVHLTGWRLVEAMRELRREIRMIGSEHQTLWLMRQMGELSRSDLRVPLCRPYNVSVTHDCLDHDLPWTTKSHWRVLALTADGIRVFGGTNHTDIDCPDSSAFEPRRLGFDKFTALELRRMVHNGVTGSSIRDARNKSMLVFWQRVARLSEESGTSL